MIVLLSPAKTMVGTSPIDTPPGSAPRFAAEASDIALQMAQMPIDELGRVLNLSPKLALASYRRYQEFHEAHGPSLPAILAYTGVVFKQIDPKGLSFEQFRFAQEHLRIVSGLYGLLRPLDRIRPYRMEFEVRLPGLFDGNLYAFWRDRQTELLIRETRDDDGLLLNLASQDVQPAFHWKEVERSVRVITPEFKVWKGGRSKTVVIYAKMCRGQMSRFILEEGLSDPEGLKGFAWEGFAFREELSDENRWVFLQE